MVASTDAEAVVRCDACPVLCRIKPGRQGVCDRYGNVDGRLVRTDPLLLTERAAERQDQLVPFAARAQQWDGDFFSPSDTFVTGVGAGNRLSQKRSMRQPKVLRWRLCCLSTLLLSAAAFTPLAIPAGRFEPMLGGLPLTLWVGVLIALAIVVLTYIGARVHPGADARNRDQP